MPVTGRQQPGGKKYRSRRARRQQYAWAITPPPVPFTALLSAVPGAAWPGLFTPGDPGPTTPSASPVIPPASTCAWVRSSYY